MNKHTLILPIAGAVLVLTALAGCSPSPTSPTSSSSSSSTPGGAASTAAKPTPIPSIPAGTGIIQNTTMTRCATTGTAVTAKGTVTIPKGSTGDVVISVSWVNSGTSAVYTRGVTTIKDLHEGDSKNWAIRAALPAGAKSVSCVLGSVIPK